MLYFTSHAAPISATAAACSASRAANPFARIAFAASANETRRKFACSHSGCVVPTLLSTKGGRVNSRKAPTATQAPSARRTSSMPPTASSQWRSCCASEIRSSVAQSSCDTSIASVARSGTLSRPSQRTISHG